jgi:hypothetical protein
VGGRGGGGRGAGEEGQPLITPRLRRPTRAETQRVGQLVGALFSSCACAWGTQGAFRRGVGRAPPSSLLSWSGPPLTPSPLSVCSSLRGEAGWGGRGRAWEGELWCLRGPRSPPGSATENKTLHSLSFSPPRASSPPPYHPPTPLPPCCPFARAARGRAGLSLSRGECSLSRRRRRRPRRRRPRRPPLPPPRPRLGPARPRPRPRPPRGTLGALPRCRSSAGTTRGGARAPARRPRRSSSPGRFGSRRVRSDDGGRARERRRRRTSPSPRRAGRPADDAGPGKFCGRRGAPRALARGPKHFARAIFFFTVGVLRSS